MNSAQRKHTTSEIVPVSLPRPQEPLPSPEEAHARLISAARDKLRIAIEAPLTPSSLMLLERTIKLVRQMIVLGKDPRALAPDEALIAMGFPGYDLPLPGEPNSGGSGVPQSTTATSAEQFGAQAMRQFANLLSGPKPPPEPSTTELIYAISAARKEGLHEVAKDLREQLKARTSRGVAAKAPRIIHVHGKSRKAPTKSRKQAKAS